MKLNPGEKKIAVFRKHWFYLALEAFLFALIAILPYLMVYFGETHFDISIPDRFVPLYELFYSLWLVFVWVGFFVSITNYLLDIWILTSERLIDIEQFGLFSRRISTLQIDKIQDVTVAVSGVIEEIISSGNVSVQTAGETHEFHIPHAQDPEKMKERILTVVRVKANEIKTVRIEN